MSKLQDQLPTFVASSARAHDYPELILRNAERFPEALAELGDFGNVPVEPVPEERFSQDSSLVEQFKERVQHHRANKLPCLHRIYSEVLGRLGPEEPLNILEIGLGTDNLELISNNGPNFAPGASLRVFRDLCPNSQIFGADVDRSILFAEPRIRTTWVDQLDPPSFEAMHQDFGAPAYDLIIDDGLHAISANLNTLLFGLRTLNPGGFVVIEDIWSYKVCWKTVYRLLPKEEFETTIVDCPTGFWVCIVRKHPAQN